MGLDLYHTEPTFRQEMDRCFETLKPIMGLNLKEIIYPNVNVGAIHELPLHSFPAIQQTRIAQPLLFIIEYALAKLLMSWDILPAAMIGHSIGEYVAACLSGVFSLEDALELVALRGELMQRMPEGAMLSVALAETEIAPLLAEGLSLAAVNAPSSCVVSGEIEAVGALAEALKEKGIQCRQLHTSHAFHSAMMDPVLEEFKQAVEKISLHKPAVPYISNITGHWVTAGQVTDPAYWANHLRSTVRFAKGIETLFSIPGCFIEVGPGKVLSTFVRQQTGTGTSPGPETVNLVRHPQEEGPDDRYLLNKIGHLWLAGVDIDWQKWYAGRGEKRRRIPLPVYPFQRQRCWIDGNPFAAGAKLQAGGSRLNKKKDITDWFYIPSWKRIGVSYHDEGTLHAGTCWLVFSDDCGAGAQMIEELELLKQVVVTVRVGEAFKREKDRTFTIYPGEKGDNDYALLFAELKRQDLVPVMILHLWGISGKKDNPLEPASVSKDLDLGYYSLLNIARQVGEYKLSKPVQMTVVTSGMQEVTGGDNYCPAKATVLGAIGVIRAEYANISCRSIDVELPGPGEKELSGQLLNACTSVSAKPVIAFRGEHCWARSYEPVQLKSPSTAHPRLKHHGVYLITGGTGGVGLILAKYLAKSVQARLVLTGRSEIPTEGHIIGKIRELEDLGSEVSLFSADVSDLEQMQQVITETLKQYGRIDGVIHAAGVPDGEMIRRRMREASERVFASKINGTLVLHRLLEGIEPDFFVICSSMSSILPQVGQAGYCAANAFIDSFALYRNRSHKTFTAAIDWDRWQQVGMAVIAEEKHKEMTDKDAAEGMTAQQGVEVFLRILAANYPQVAAVSRDLEALLEHTHSSRLLAPADENKEPEAPAALQQRPNVKTVYKAPANKTEEVIAGIWARYFGFQQVGVLDDFFELGGDSLKAVTIMARIHEHLDVDVSLAEFFKYPTVRQLARHILRDARKSPFTSIPIAETREYYPLSSAQERLYLVQQMQTQNTGYNMPYIMAVTGEFNLNRAEEVFKQLIKRHESLRTSFDMVNSQPVQKIEEDALFEIEHFQIKKANKKQKAQLSAISRFVRPFDLSKAPLLRVGWAETETKEESLRLLMVDLHHITTDGASMQVLVREFLRLYAGEDLPLMKLQYKDFACWQQLEREKGMIDAQREYWQRELAGEIPVLDLPYDFPRPVVQQFEGSRVSFTLSSLETDALNDLARREKSTLFMVLLTVYSLFLARVSGQEDIIIGTPVSGRRHADLDAIIGIFVNVLGLRTAPCGTKSVASFLSEVNAKTSGAFENQDYPFEDLVKELNVQRDTGRNPLFDSVFSLEDPFTGSLEETIKETGAGKMITPYAPSDYLHTSKFDLSLAAENSGEQLHFTFTYSTALFKEETLLRFIEYFKRIVTQVISKPGQKINEIEIVSPEETQRLLIEFNKASASYPSDKTIHRLFAEQAAKTPDRIAITDHRSISYRQLNDQSDILARSLQEKGVTPGTIVAIQIERSILLIIGLLAILKTGAAYLPIDPSYPEERKRFMLSDSNAKVLVSDIGANLVFARDTHHLHLPPAPAPSLAYILYTSGSTGTPRGVMVEHRSVVNLCSWHNRYYDVTKRDHAGQYAEPGFDASVWEIFPYLLKGACLHIIPEELKVDMERLNAYFEKYHITIAFLPTPACEMFMQLENHSLRLLLTGGDKLKTYQKRNYRLVNNYGPTENTVVSTSFPVTANLSNIPIGSPIDNTRCFILSRYQRLQPVGIAGELYLAGDNLARGYLNNPELTAERFVISQLSLVNGESFPNDQCPMTNDRLYYTGDLARWLSSGSIQFLGRVDSQVKIRGFRIELGEIENRLLNHEKVKEAAVIKREQGEDVNLCAYIVPDSAGDIDVSSIKEYLSRYLPAYMIPVSFKIMDRLPLLSSGKLNRRALPQPDTGTTDYGAAPATRTEKRLAQIWAEVLGIEVQRIGLGSDFFESGGHSLSAMALVTKVHKEFQVKLSLIDVFTRPALGAMAGLVEEASKEQFHAIEPAEEKEYYPLSSAQRRLYILQHIDVSAAAYNVYGMYEIEGQWDREKLEEICQRLIERHDSLRTSFFMKDGEPVQKVHEEVEFSIEDLNMQETNPPGLSGFIRPFDLSRAPLLRVGVLKKGDRGSILLIDMHHIVTDAISLEILIREFASLYSGTQLPPLTLQYKDYSQWQQTAAVHEVLNEQEKYWLSKFEEGVPQLHLPVDFLRPTVRSFDGSIRRFDAVDSQMRALIEMARSEGVTLFILLLAVFKVFLYKINCQEDLVVGVPAAGRNHADLQGIIGMFVNTLALRTQPSGNITARNFLQQVKETALEAFDNQDYPFEDLVDKAVTGKDMSRSPVFDVMFALEEQPATPGAGRDTISPKEPSTLRPFAFEHKTSKFDVTLTAVRSPGHLHFTFEYCTRLFKEETISRLIKYFNLTLAHIIENPDREIKDIEIVTGEEKQQLLFEFNNTAADFPKDKTLQILFEEQAEKTPDHIAITARVGAQHVAPMPRIAPTHASLTYRELNEQSNRLSNTLKQKGLTPGSIAAFMMERSVEIIIAIFGILKAGCAYLPIDPSYPEERKKFMLADSSAEVLVTDVGANLVFGRDPHHLHLSPAPAPSLAYILYTSGTTGLPKGVMIEHRSVANVVTWLARHYGLGPGKHVLQMHSYTFDGHVNQVFGSLLHGASLYEITPDVLGDMEALRDYVIKHAIQVMDFVPGYLFELLTKGKKMDSLQVIISAGDKLDLQVKDDIIARGYPLFNHYGPTETTVDALTSHCTPENANSFTPIANTSCYILDQSLNLLPIGVAGEIYLTGPGVARGYLNQPELTAERFVISQLSLVNSEPSPNDQCPMTNDILYRTGDLGRWLADGHVEFLGRKDGQVKIRGIRIELAEIENQLLSHENVKEAVVLARQMSANAAEKGTGQKNEKYEKILCAYLTGDLEKETAAVQLREFLFLRLPPALIPGYFILLDKLPATGTGKLDRQALEAMDLRQESTVPYVSPQNETESKILYTWKQVLHLDKVGIHDNYFQMGGTSLDILRVHARLKEEFQRDIPVTALFGYPTVHSLACYLESGEKELRDRSEAFERGKRDRMQRLEKRRGMKKND
jgi:amino acid adenylation domain-containing protein